MSSSEYALEAKFLVSVVVATYNSELTIAETLESILLQDYPLIEVIITDDGSSDGTMASVHDWVELNAPKFERIVVLTANCNEGICRNVTKGYSRAKGEWIKPIAGDDLLTPESISTFALAAANSNHAVIVSMVAPFHSTLDNRREFGEPLPVVADAELIKGDSKKLLAELHCRNQIPAPGVFLKRQAIDESGGIDLAFKHLDDWPLWIKLLRLNYTFGMLPRVLVHYRVSELSISASRNFTLVNRDLLNDLITFYAEYQRDFVGTLDRWDQFIQVQRIRQAVGPLRTFPRLYRLTGLVRLLSPRYWSTRILR
ncbi:glycosyltransferase [Massilia sp. DWR3-1-1]|uniref:glycosyltransferase n=1 Tax=Massilia sp. DWR3-1-1 TaxID=2804559 RepID=UPI003CFB9DD4